MRKILSIIICFVLSALSLFLCIGVKYIDVGTNAVGSQVGFYSLNSMMDYKANEALDKIGDVLLILGFLAFGAIVALGIYQLIKNKSLKKVNLSIYIYGVMAVLCPIFYLGFEKKVFNSRPILVDGVLEASFPSTHVFIFTALVLGAIYVIDKVYKIKYFSIIAYSISGVLILAMAILRLASGMHWITDVVGGLLIGGFLFSLNPFTYHQLSFLVEEE